jgi:rod shape-determining protein MreD
VSQFLPARPEARRRLAWSTGLVAALSLLNLVPVSFGMLGSPWPLVLLWPICGWTSLGPSLVAAFLLFCLGLWVDVITGGPLGMWALVALGAHGLLLLLGRLMNIAGLDAPVKMALTTGLTIVMCVLVGLLESQPIGVAAMIVPCLGASLTYRFVRHWFEFEEDEA